MSDDDRDDAGANVSLLEAFDAGEYDIACIYTFCDVSLRNREGLLRHLMDCHGHSWESAHQSVQEAEDDG